MQVSLFDNMPKKVIIKYQAKKFIAVAIAGKDFVGPTDSKNEPTQGAVSLKEVDDAAGVEGCHWSNDRFIESPNLLGKSEVSPEVPAAP